MSNKFRYRIFKGGFLSKPLLVLQIGTRQNTGDSDDICPSERNKEYYQWRDATVEDLTQTDGVYPDEQL